MPEFTGREKNMASAARVMARTLVQLAEDRRRMVRGKKPKIPEREVKLLLKNYPEEAGAWYQALAEREGVH